MQLPPQQFRYLRERLCMQIIISVSIDPNGQLASNARPKLRILRPLLKLQALESRENRSRIRLVLTNDERPRAHTVIWILIIPRPYLPDDSNWQTQVTFVDDTAWSLNRVGSFTRRWRWVRLVQSALYASPFYIRSVGSAREQTSLVFLRFS